jgi:hypothetical protein
LRGSDGVARRFGLRGRAGGERFDVLGAKPIAGDAPVAAAHLLDDDPTDRPLVSAVSVRVPAWS